MNRDNIIYFIPKVINRIRLQKIRLYKYIDIEKMSMRGYRGFTDKAFKKRLSEMLGVYNASILEKIDEHDRETIISSAEKALSHEFDLLGSGPVKLDPIDWQIDFKCGAKWEKKYYQEIGYIKGADIKMPWELSRCQHLLWLGEAYLLTDEKKYAKEVIEEIEWWIADNPLMYTVNWKCAMDVAFRAVNWMFALNMISSYEGFNGVFEEQVARSLWQHAFFIRNNLEKAIPDSNNHYTSDLVGLLYLGALFYDNRNGQKWLRLAKKELRKETLNQVLPSGVHYEKSVSYHRLMTEMLSYPVYMLKRVGMDVNVDVMTRIRDMYAYVANYTKPNGMAPLIADNDDGRFAPFLKRDFRIHNYLNDTNSVENKIITNGIEPLFCTKDTSAKLYDDAGVAIIRNAQDYVFINHGGFSGRPKEFKSVVATHTHNDLLSFELCLNGKELIVDAGTYLYTSSEKDRNHFRSTSKHNTIVVDKEEQNDFVESFSLGRNVIKRDLIKTANNEVEGEYKTIKGKLGHKRRFKYESGQVIITDTLTKGGTGHIAELYLHFSENVNPVLSGDSILLGNNIIHFNVKPSIIKIVVDSLSPSFGVLEKSTTAIALFEFKDSITIETKILSL